MGYVVEAVAYVSGALLIGAGLFLVLRGTFPGWWRRQLLWPLVHVTRRVARLQGLAAMGLGASMILLVFTTVAADAFAGVLVLGGLGAYLVAVALYAVSTYLSRRTA